MVRGWRRRHACHVRNHLRQLPLIVAASAAATCRHCLDSLTTSRYAFPPAPSRRLLLVRLEGGAQDEKKEVLGVFLKLLIFFYNQRKDSWCN